MFSPRAKVRLNAIDLLELREMTSWIRQPRPVGAREELDVVFQTGLGGFCSQFNQYLYHVQYSRRLGKTLFLKDTPNCLSADYTLIRSTFQDISGVKYVETLPAKAPTQDMKVFDAISRTPRETLRAAAQEVLRWRPELEAQIQTILSAANLPTKYDLGLHIRSGDKKPVPLDRYLRAIDQHAAGARAKSLNVFIACDNSTILKEFQARTKGSPHNFVVIGGDHPAGGHIQSVFNAKSFDDKFNDAMVFFTELYILQKCPAIVCTLSSSVGKFLYLTAASVRAFKSLDLADFVPL